MSTVQVTTAVQCSGTKLPEQLNTLFRPAEQNTEQPLNKESLLSLISMVSAGKGLNKPLNKARTQSSQEVEHPAEQTVVQLTCTSSSCTDCPYLSTKPTDCSFPVVETRGATGRLVGLGFRT